MRLICCFLMCLTFCSCRVNHPKVAQVEKSDPAFISFKVPIKEFDDAQYPDNPDIGFRHDTYGTFSHDSVEVIQVSQTSFELRLNAGNAQSDQIVFPEIKLMVMMPKVPSWLIGNQALTELSVINQEWNRHQVRFDREAGFFQVQSLDSTRFEFHNITRIDLARNCLSSGLWEIIGYAQQEGSSVPYYHGWFDFPLDLYANLFNQANPGINFEQYSAHLTQWKDPKKEWFDASVLRERTQELKPIVHDLNHTYDQEKGALLKRKKNIIYPQNVTRIQDYLTDSTVFSTFSAPGCYRSDDPRSTELGLFHTFLGAKVYEIKHAAIQNQNLIEIELKFLDQTEKKGTTLMFGGLDLAKFPALADTMHHQGDQYPMGFSNHLFYETYPAALQNEVENNPYYGVILDQEGIWLDSHAVGIDGPQFFWDAALKNVLHLHLLSFERHSYVGHFTFDFNE